MSGAFTTQWLLSTPLICFKKMEANINHLEGVQHFATRLVSGFRHVPYEESLHQLNFLALERRRLRTDLILLFQNFKGEIQLNPSNCFLCPTRPELRAHLRNFATAKSFSIEALCVFWM